MAMPTTPTDPTAAAIAWLKGEEGRAALKKWPVEIDGETLRYDRFAAGVIRWWLDDGQGEGWRRISPTQSVALVEHAWRRELEKRYQRVDISKRGCGQYVVTCSDGIRFTVPFVAPTLPEALHKALETTA
jgi:hypothetical protein